ncbi:CbrC family protein [Clostridium sp. MSJ-4]|uniref:CbrC family protein n=1 Tax=Clostridium simiarum TaxID=2841506 RepID=A0ABS6EYT4_9CLOT|nr:CbrC family protein [Clostridium simiarum]MBU5591295.1 CbrC family protein [Clostridium simiarum]
MEKDLPKFKYHPDPIKTGAFSTNKSLGYFMPNQMNEFRYKDLVFIMNTARYKGERV